MSIHYKGCKLWFKDSFTSLSWATKGRYNILSIFLFLSKRCSLFLSFFFFLFLLLVYRFLLSRLLLTIGFLVLAMATMRCPDVVTEWSIAIDVIKDNLLRHLDLVAGKCVLDLYLGFFSCSRRSRGRWFIL